MRFGIFDHLDHAAGSLTELYEMRLALIEMYDAAGFHAYHLAEHHGTNLGAAPSHVESVYAELEDIEQPIAIVGHSMGGRIGLLLHEKLSRETPGRAGPLILIDPAIGQPRFRPIIKIFFGNLLGSNEPEDKAMRMLKAVREIPPTDEEARKYATNFRKGRKGFKTNSLAVGAALRGHKEKIANVEAQLLFVWGIKDPLMPVSQGDDFMTLNTGAEIEKIAGCGHIPHEEAPNVVLPLIAKALL